MRKNFIIRIDVNKSKYASASKNISSLPAANQNTNLCFLQGSLGIFHPDKSFLANSITATFILKLIESCGALLCRQKPRC